MSISISIRATSRAHGASGSGKTTLLNLIGGLDSPRRELFTLQAGGSTTSVRAHSPNGVRPTWVLYFSFITCCRCSPRGRMSSCLCC